MNRYKKSYIYFRSLIIKFSVNLTYSSERLFLNSIFLDILLHNCFGSSFNLSVNSLATQSIFEQLCSLWISTKHIIQIAALQSTHYILRVFSWCLLQKLEVIFSKVLCSTLPSIAITLWPFVSLYFIWSLKQESHKYYWQLTQYIDAGSLASLHTSQLFTFSIFWPSFMDLTFNSFATKKLVEKCLRPSFGTVCSFLHIIWSPGCLSLPHPSRHLINYCIQDPSSIIVNDS